MRNRSMNRIMQALIGCDRQGQDDQLPEVARWGRQQFGAFNGSGSAGS
jgi:hypothetical protein